MGLKSTIDWLLWTESVLNNQKQAREVADIQTRSCNLMIYNCMRLSESDPAKEVAKTYV